jgi:D-serine deaminase-like pyridoxal phosphate-dependent protein
VPETSPLSAAAEAAPSTPALVVELDTLERNLERMAAATRASGFALRPHAKTHKCPNLAERQLAGGAVGLTVATIGEAEAFAAAGVADDFFIAYPLWLDENKQRRLAKLAAEAHVRVGLDSVENARRIVGTGASVVIEVDSGHHRSGIRPAGAGELARAAAELGLTVNGVFTFPGHGSGRGMTQGPTLGPAETRERAVRDQDEALSEAVAAMREAGIEPEVISGGSTPTAGLARPGQINELRPGVYVFNDAMQVALGTCELGDVALTAAATVVSVPAADRFILDTGSKALGADPNAWAPGYGLLPAYPGSTVVQLSEHHAVVQLPAELPEGVTAPRHGERVAIVPNHVCSAVNLTDELVIVRQGTHVDTWPVAARGRNS